MKDNQCGGKKFGQTIKRLGSGEETDDACFLPVSSLLSKLLYSLTLYDVCCTGYAVNFSTVKNDVLGNIAEVLVKRSDHGAKGGSGVVFKSPDTKPSMTSMY